MMAATFQSIWINSHWALRRRRNTPSPWKRYEHLAEFKAAPVSQAGSQAVRQAVTAELEILKQPVATKGVFSCGGAYRRMRSRCDPAQLQPRSRTGTLQVAFSSVFFSKGGGRDAELRFPPVRGEGNRRGVRPLSARHGFLEGHRRFRRPSHVIGAKTRVSGHLNYLQERERERERGEERRGEERGTVGPIFFFF